MHHQIMAGWPAAQPGSHQVMAGQQPRLAPQTPVWASISSPMQRPHPPPVSLARSAATLAAVATLPAGVSWGMAPALRSPAVCGSPAGRGTAGAEGRQGLLGLGFRVGGAGALPPEICMLGPGGTAP